MNLIRGKLLKRAGGADEWCWPLPAPPGVPLRTLEIHFRAVIISIKCLQD